MKGQRWWENTAVYKFCIYDSFVECRKLYNCDKKMQVLLTENKTMIMIKDMLKKHGDYFDFLIGY